MLNSEKITVINYYKKFGLCQPTNYFKQGHWL